MPAKPLPSPSRLRVSATGRFLEREGGEPFFWLGDTAWELFHRLNLADAEHYLTTRADQGFTVIQAVALAELEGLNSPNAQGDLPFRDGDPARPTPAYWAHVDAIVRRANDLGLLLGFLPTWGSFWKEKSIFQAENAETYGRWLGERYRDTDLVWILGGDRRIESEAERDILRAMARGLRHGDGGAHLRTVHTQGDCGSAEVLPDEPWLDFHMRQNGHAVHFDGRYERTLTDYRRSPAKPVIDGEPVYEDIPIDFDAARFGHATATDVRRALYWDLFSGAFGHTYGHNSVWQMWTPERPGMLQPFLSWREALHQPGARQQHHARRLLESRPSHNRIPDPALIVSGAASPAIPGAGPYRFVATRDAGGDWAMIYAPVGRPFQVDTGLLKGEQFTAWWFDPRTGKAERRESFSRRDEKWFLSPNPGEAVDWILTLDNSERLFAPPGTPARSAQLSTRANGAAGE